MTTQLLTTYAIGAAFGAAMLAFTAAPASAFTLSAPHAERSIASPSIEKAWWVRRRWVVRRYYWGPRHCWRNYWGYLRCW